METSALTIHINHYRQKILLWFWSHSAREQLLVMVVAIAAFMCMFFIGIWAPAEDKLDKMQTTYMEERALSEWLNDNAPLAKQVAPGAVNAGDTPPLSIIMTDTAKKEGLVIKRLELNKEEAQVTLERVPFNTLITWLYILGHTYHVRLVSVSVTSTDAIGYVNAVVKSK